MTKVLILTNRNDDHARVVAECLRKKGASPIKWFPEEFLINQKGSQKITSNGRISIFIKEDEAIDLSDIDVVWYRRSSFPILINQIHQSDKKFVEIENRLYMKGLWQTLGESAKWINPYTSFDKSNCKAIQLREAARLGLFIPETLITNDVEKIRNFIHKNKESGTIYKTFSPPYWHEDDISFNFYTTSLTAEVLPDEALLRLTPGIYQKKIEKNFEVRITFFGQECVAVKIHNSDALDWRVLSGTSKFKISHIRIPYDIEQKCILLMEALGIVFGCFDFIVTPSGEYVFMEVNEMGQFLWIEEMLPELKLLNKFCDFLLYDEKETKILGDLENFSLNQILDSEAYNNLVKKDFEQIKKEKSL